MINRIVPQTAYLHLILKGVEILNPMSSPAKVPLPIGIHEHFSSMKDRFKGYFQALEEHQVEIPLQYQKEGKHGRQEAMEMALELLQLPKPPTAIFAACDTQAIGVLDAAKQMNLSVPDDLSVVGYDDIRDAGYVNLTTIQQPLYESGVEGGKALIKMIDCPDPEPLETILPVSLVIRNTTAAPKK